MILSKENRVIIFIPTEHPAETLGGLQTGMLELLRTNLSKEAGSESVKLPRSIVHGYLAVLDLLEATLVNPETVEAVLHISNEVSDLGKRIKGLRHDLGEVVEGSKKR